tara:strand:+ start:34 stop:171 length:138 start_codon:yes stop_codon:yes gene_type:complete
VHIKNSERTRFPALILKVSGEFFMIAKGYIHIATVECAIENINEK